MSINKEGYLLILIVLIGSCLFLFIGSRWQSPLILTLALIGFVKVIFLSYFFRDPERKLPSSFIEGKTLLAPADGEVMEIVDEPDGKSRTIRIFLSVFNVHIQRAPASGKITKIERMKGKYLPAMKENAHKQNEQNIITIETNSGEKIIVRQIVGILARRLVLWKKEGDVVSAGERLGMIKFGSQVDITFLASYKTTVALRDAVSGGESIIAQK